MERNVSHKVLPNATLHAHGNFSTSDILDFSTNILTNIVSCFTAFSCISTILINGLIILVYCRTRSLRTSFSIYIVNLSVSEFLLGILSMPGNFVISWYGYWPYSFGLCSVVSTSGQIFSSAARFAHVLISFNRLWAVTFPLSFKLHHTVRMSVFIVLVTWMLLLAVHLPVTIPGRMWASVDDKLCLINTSFQYTTAVAEETVAFTLPEILVVLSYPVIAYKLHLRGVLKAHNKVDMEPSMQSKRFICHRAAMKLLNLVRRRFWSLWEEARNVQSTKKLRDAVNKLEPPGFSSIVAGRPLLRPLARKELV